MARAGYHSRSNHLARPTSPRISNQTAGVIAGHATKKRSRLSRRTELLYVIKCERLKWILDAVRARIAVPLIAAYLPHLLHISRYNETAVAAPRNAGVSLS